MPARLVVLSLLVLAACPRAFAPPPAPQTGRECTFNGDCGPRRVCADGRCRAECHTDRDCAGGALCRPSEVQGEQVCLPAQTAALCFFTSDCLAPQVCGGDNHCHQPCHSDTECAPGTCDVTAGLCVADAPVEAAGGCVVCGERCVDLSSDPAHCGACEIACGPGGSCVGGACTEGVCADAGPCNSVCSGAQALTLIEGRGDFSFDPTPYSVSPLACDAADNAGFYRLHLDGRAYLQLSLDLPSGSGQGTGNISLRAGCEETAAQLCGQINCSGGNPILGTVAERGETVLAVDGRPGLGALPFHVVTVPLSDQAQVVPLPGSPVRFTVNAKVAAPQGTAPGVCGGSAIAAGWYAPNPCLSSGAFTAQLAVTTCGSDPGVSAGFFDSTAGRAQTCSDLDAGCPGGSAFVVSVNRGDPIFIFATLPPGADGGSIQLNGTFQ